MQTLAARYQLPVLVTGATGFIGSHVVDALLQDGYHVRALRRSADVPDFTAAWSQSGIRFQWHAGDLLEPKSLTAAVRGISAVVHCAALVSDGGDLELHRRVNVNATKHLVSVAASAGSQRFVYLSTLGVYEPRDHFGSDEQTAINSQGFDPYTITKIEAERAVIDSAWAQKTAQKSVILRPGFTYGRRDRVVMPRLINAIRRRRIIYAGSGQQLLNNTAVGNLVDAVRLALTRELDPGSIFNITDARLVTKRTFVEAVAQHLQLPPPTHSLPRPLFYAMTKTYEALFNRQNQAPEPLLSMARYKFMALNLEFSIEKAKRLLGYQPRYEFNDVIGDAVASARGGASL